jgi:hypothetical protein
MGVGVGVGVGVIVGVAVAVGVAVGPRLRPVGSPQDASTSGKTRTAALRLGGWRMAAIIR